MPGKAIQTLSGILDLSPLNRKLYNKLLINVRSFTESNSHVNRNMNSCSSVNRANRIDPKSYIIRSAIRSIQFAQSHSSVSNHVFMKLTRAVLTFSVSFVRIFQLVHINFTFSFIHALRSHWCLFCFSCEAFVITFSLPHLSKASYHLMLVLLPFHVSRDEIRSDRVSYCFIDSSSAFVLSLVCQAWSDNWISRFVRFFAPRLNWSFTLHVSITNSIQLLFLFMPIRSYENLRVVASHSAKSFLCKLSLVGARFGASGSFECWVALNETLGNVCINMKT